MKIRRKQVSSKLTTLNNTLPRRAYLLFKLFEVHETIDTSETPVAPLDVDIASTVDSRTDPCVQTTVTDRFISRNFQRFFSLPEKARTTATKKNQAFCTRGDREPMYSG